MLRFFSGLSLFLFLFQISCNDHDQHRGGGGDGGHGHVDSSAAAARAQENPSTDTVIGEDQNGCSALAMGAFSKDNGVYSVDGNDFRSGDAETPLVITGAATQWRVKVTRSGLGSSVPEQTFADAPLRRTDSNRRLIPLADFIDKNSWRSLFLDVRATIAVTGLDSTGAAVGNPCSLLFILNSPLVLVLGKVQKLEDISVLESPVAFDLDADGKREKTGWVRPSAAFLVLDQNGNGTIDDGRELFGEYSQRGSQQRFQHGYEVLAWHDRDKNGLVDERDPDFAKLQLWRDDNSDGISQKHELFRLGDFAITSLSTRYAANTQPAKAAPFANQIPYSAAFFGPSWCGTAGCRSYDIFFGTLK